jgi:hypothetical protein
MRLALTNLDTGLFLDRGGWTADSNLAQTFCDLETVAKMAQENKVRNAAAMMLGGEPPQATGFLWVTHPSSQGGG